jgi:CheY-like chemotaxis protein
MAAESPPLVVVLDSDPDTTEMLQMALQAAGFAVVTGNLHEFRTGEDDLLAFLERTEPDVILYDLSPPYEKNWTYLETMRQHPAFARPGLVITTTNKRAVEKLVSLPVVEIFGKPYDLDVLTSAVRTALTAPTTSDGEDRRRRDDRRTGDDRRSLGDRRAGSPTE